jgi:hypothetical protein
LRICAWGLLAVYEKEGVGASGHGGLGPKALKHLSNFFFVRCLPVMAITAFTEFSIFGDGARIEVNAGAKEGPVIAAWGIGNGGCKKGEDRAFRCRAWVGSHVGCSDGADFTCA